MLKNATQRGSHLTITVLVAVIALFQIFGGSMIRQSAIEKEEGRVAAAITAYAQKLDVWLELQRAAFDAMSVALQLLDSPDHDEVAKILAAYHSGRDDIVLDYYVAKSTDGHFISAIGDEPTGIDARERDWYKQAKAAGKLIYTEPYIDFSSNQAVITIVKPIKIGSTDVMVAGDIVVNGLIELTDNISIGRDSYAFLLSREGNIITHRDSSLLPTEAGSKKFAAYSTLKGCGTLTDYDGAQKLAATQTIYGTGWTLGIIKPMYDADWETYKNKIILFIVLVAIAAIIYALRIRYETSEQIRQNRDELKVMVEERTKELQESNAKLLHVAYYEPDTDLPNRVALMEWLAEEIESAKASGRGGSIIAVSLDDVHIIGSSFGRAICDEVIRKTAERLKALAPKDSFCAHPGSNEFFIACPSLSDRDTLRTLLENFCRSMRMEVECEGITLSVTASIGGAIYPEDGGTPTDVIRSADSAMFSAKLLGKNCACVYTQEMHEAFYDDLALTHEMKKAVADKEFFLAYQPQVDATTHRLIGYEALIRWPNAQRGFVSPSRFIPLAEKNGLIIPIGRWVFDDACKFAKRLKESGHSDVRISINVSARQLARPDFLSTVIDLIASNGIEAGQIEIEVTETIFINSLEASIEKLAAVRRQGIKIAIDDFGTGYSSLSYLQQLPFDTLKIDKSFIDHIPSDEKDCELVKAIIAMSKILGKATISEGVETEEQLNCLKEYGCDIIQGFYFSKPLPADEAIDFLEKNRAAC